MARRPSQARDSIQLTALKNAVVAPRHAPMQSTPCSAIDSVERSVVAEKVSPALLPSLHLVYRRWQLLPAAQASLCER